MSISITNRQYGFSHTNTFRCVCWRGRYGSANRRLEVGTLGEGEGPGSNALCVNPYPSRPAGRAAALARLHQHHREHKRHRPTSLPQRQTLAGRCNGAALDRHRHARGRPGLSDASRPTSNSRACAEPSQPIRTGTRSATTLNSRPSPHSLVSQQRLPSKFQHGEGHPPERPSIWSDDPNETASGKPGTVQPLGSIGHSCGRSFGLHRSG